MTGRAPSTSSGQRCQPGNHWRQLDCCGRAPSTSSSPSSHSQWSVAEYTSLYNPSETMPSDSLQEASTSPMPGQKALNLLWPSGPTTFLPQHPTEAMAVEWPTQPCGFLCPGLLVSWATHNPEQGEPWLSTLLLIIKLAIALWYQSEDLTRAPATTRPPASHHFFFHFLCCCFVFLRQDFSV